MYHTASGYQQYSTQGSHDEHTQQPYAAAPYPRSIYLDPTDPRHPQNQVQDASYYYPPQPPPPPPEVYAEYAPHGVPPQMAPGTSFDHASVYAQPLPVDPAFSADPRANLNNPYAHYTAYRMDSREEILPMGISHSHDSFYDVHPQQDTSYQPRDPRVIPATSRKHHRDISSIYGPPRAQPPDSRPLSDGSHYAHSLYAAPSVHDQARASAASVGGVRLPYDAPETHAGVVPIPPPMNNPSSSSSKSKLHKKHHSMDHHEHRGHSSASVYAASAAASSFSSPTSSFVYVQTPGGKSSTSLPSVAKSHSKSSLYVANPSPDSHSYVMLKPDPGSPHSSLSSRSSASSPEEPITPPQMTPEKSHASSKSSKLSKRSRSRSPYRKDPLQLDTDKVNDIINVTATEDFPPAYTPLPAQSETSTALSPVTESKQDNTVSVILSPEGISLSSSRGQAAEPGPSRERERSPPRETNEQGAMAMPEPHVPTPRHSPPREAAPELAFPSTSQPQSSSSVQAPQPSAQAPAEIKKSRSRKHSISTPPKDLDKIDELDETDPLGFAWHHDSPYEAILRAVKNSNQQGNNAAQESGGPKIFAAMNGTDTRAGQGSSKKSHRKPPPPMDPSITSFKVKPGEIFPPILPPQQIPLPPGVVPTPMSPQAPMSPVQKQAFVNAHLRPVGKYEPVPPPFSPTPSQMERATNPAHRMSMMSQMTSAEPRMYFSAQQQHQQQQQQPLPPSLASAHSHSHSQAPSQRSHHSSSSGSVPSSSHASTSSRSVPRVPPPQAPSDYPDSSRRPQPLPVQPRPQSTLSRSNTTPAPRTMPLPAEPVQYQKPASAPYLLSADPPPTPDIQLPPPSVRSRSIAPPSVHSTATSRHGQPQPHYLPKRLVMPTPLQPMQPLPQQQQPPPGVPMSAASASYPHRGRGENSRVATSGLKRGVTVGAMPMAQDIPMSSGRNLLKKHKDTKVKDRELEKDIKEFERRENDVERERERETEREKVREREQAERERARERVRGKGRSASVSVPPGAAVFASTKVVVPVEPTKSSGGGWGFSLFGGGDREKKEKEKEREREREREKEKERSKKLSKRR